MWMPVSKLINLQVAYVFLREAQKNLENVVLLLYNVYTYYTYVNNFYMITRSKFGYIN